MPDLPINSHPSYRATIVGETLTLTPWNPALARGGAMLRFVRDARERGASIVDLTPLPGEPGDREVIASSPLPGPLGEQAKQTFAGWARAVGYRRVWFDDELRELDSGQPFPSEAAVECPTCGARWEDGTPAFWLHVQATGAFPNLCPVCGASLPQWQIAEANASPDAPALAEEERLQEAAVDEP